MKDKHLEYTGMDDALPKRRGKESDKQSQAVDPVDPPDNAGSGRSYDPSETNEAAPQSETESTEDSA
jgi:hypothetical protein